MIAELGTLAWIALAASAIIVGFSKIALPGANTLAVALFAAVLPAKLSTGALLVLLIVGDMLALATYRRAAQWQTLWRLSPAVIAGLLLGVVFLALSSDDIVRRVIAVLLLVIVAVTLYRRYRPRTTPTAGTAAPPGTGRVSSIVYGSLGGFTTMVANAAGPVMSMYFLAARFDMKMFLGTAAWFFAIINIIKVPFSIGVGIITPETLLIDLLVVPGVFVGAILGRLLVARLSQRVFEILVVVFTVIGALYLLV